MDAAHGAVSVELSPTTVASDDGAEDERPAAGARRPVLTRGVDCGGRGTGERGGDRSVRIEKESICPQKTPLQVPIVRPHFTFKMLFNLQKERERKLGGLYAPGEAPITRKTTCVGKGLQWVWIYRNSGLTFGMTKTAAATTIKAREAQAAANGGRRWSTSSGLRTPWADEWPGRGPRS